MAHWVYLSPHLDDAVYSCGGLIWQQIQAGEQVEIWTIFSGNPPKGDFSNFAEKLHQRWGTDGRKAMPIRRQEDHKALSILQAPSLHFQLPECIYRRLPDNSYVINEEDDLWKPYNPLEQTLIDDLGKQIFERLSPTSLLVSPLALGNHIDHQIVRAAAQTTVNPLFYYADYPYVIRHPDELVQNINPVWLKYSMPISSQGLKAWQEAVAAYASQISTFWRSLSDLRSAIQEYWQMDESSTLWKANC